MGRRRGGRKRALGPRAPMAIPRDANQRWSVDFVHDTLIDGRRFRLLAVVDDFTRECLGLVADTSLSGVRETRSMNALRNVVGPDRPCLRILPNARRLREAATRCKGTPFRHS